MRPFSFADVEQEGEYDLHGVRGPEPSFGKEGWTDTLGKANPIDESIYRVALTANINAFFNAL